MFLSKNRFLLILILFLTQASIPMERDGNNKLLECAICFESKKTSDFLILDNHEDSKEKLCKSCYDKNTNFFQNGIQNCPFCRQDMFLFENTIIYQGSKARRKQIANQELAFNQDPSSFERYLHGLFSRIPQKYEKMLEYGAISALLFAMGYSIFYFLPKQFSK